MHQIPDAKSGNDRIDAVVVDDDSVGSVDAPGCGGKILRGHGALERFLAKMKDSVVWSLYLIALSLCAIKLEWWFKGLISYNFLWVKWHFSP